jgi:hypothetical protein
MQDKDNHQDAICLEIHRNENETEGVSMPILVILTPAFHRSKDIPENHGDPVEVC